MRGGFFGALWLFTLSALPLAAAPQKAAPVPDNGQEPIDQTADRWVVILGAYKSFGEAKEDALKFAKASKVPFSMNGMIFDKKGLRFPDKFDDPIWAGEYVARRGNQFWNGKNEMPEFISIERSEGYEGFAKKLYIVVGSIAESRKDAEAQTTRFKAVAPHTYSKKTRIYMGCLH